MTSSREPLPLAHPFSSWRRVSTSLLVVVGVGALLFVGSTILHRRHREAAAPAPAAPTSTRTVVLPEPVWRDAGIVVETAQTITRRTHLQAPGVLSLDETRTARIGSMVEGKIVSVSAQIGDRVTPGTALAEIHSHVIHEAWSDYRKAIADRKRRQSELDYAGQAERRAQRLYADKAISLQERQKAQVERVAAAQALEMSKTELRRSEEALAHLGITSGDAPGGESGEQIPVKSPLAGAVLEKHVTTGTAITTGMPLFVVSDLSTLWALAEVDETKLAQLRAGLPVEVRVAAYPEATFPGAIIFIGDTLDPKTRRVTVRCQVPNPQGKLKPQMYATLSFGAGEDRSFLAIPVQAVQDLDNKTVVFVTEDHTTFSPREVALGPEREGWAEVLSGLRLGEQLATSGSFLLKSELSQSAGDAEE